MFIFLMLQSSVVQLLYISTAFDFCQYLFPNFFVWKRRRRDLNPRAAINDLLPFQGSPFGLLGTSPSIAELKFFILFFYTLSSSAWRNAPMRSIWYAGCPDGYKSPFIQAQRRFAKIHGTRFTLNRKQFVKRSRNGEGGIRTHGPFRSHWFSRPAP